jgi:hypothetical protein
MKKKILLAATLLVASIGTPVFATSFTFNFNALTYSASNTADESSSIQSVLTSQLQAAGCTGCTVKVLNGNSGTGNSMGAVVDRTYNGEGYAVGPTNGTSVISETLGDTPANANFSNGNSSYGYSTVSGGYNNSFLSNTTDNGSNQISNQITLQFTGLTITAASFNYEIFPSNLNQGTPDFIFQAGTNTNGVDSQIFQTFGVAPGSGNGTNTHSPNSHSWGTETNVQYISSWSGALSNVTELDFVDWPATIGVDNLSITYNNGGGGNGGSVPEPMSVVLLGTLVGGLLLKKKLAA